MKKIIVILIILIPFICYPDTNFQVVKIDSSKLPDIKVYSRLWEKNKKLPVFNKNDFKLYFNKAQVDFSLKYKRHKIGISSLILIDASLSINRVTRNKLREQAKAVVNGMRPGDKMALFIFNDKTYKLSDFTSDKNKLKKLINDFKPSGRYSRLYDSINKCQSFVNEKIKGGRKAIVVFSDGLDEKSKFTLEKSIIVAKEERIPVYSYGYTNISKKHLDNLKLFSTETNGAFSFENNTNIIKELFPGHIETFYSFLFKIQNPKRTNFITIHNEKINKTVMVKLVLSTSDLKKIEEYNSSRKLYRILWIIFIIFLLIVLFLLIRFYKKRKSKSDSFSSSILKSDAEKRAALEKKELELDEEEKWLVTKAVLSQINKNRSSTILFYKEFFKKASIDAVFFSRFTDTVEEFYNSTSSLTFTEIKKLENIIRDFREICGKTNFNVDLSEFIIEDKLDRIQTTLSHKIVSEKDEEVIRISESVPMLKQVFSIFEADVNRVKPLSVEEIFYSESDEDIDFIMDTFLLGNSLSETDTLVRDIYELDDEKISQLIPFMISVVKDSEGFERDANVNLLKRMAQSLNLNIDDVSDVSEFADWWQKNKKQAVSNAKSSKKEKQRIELENGLYTYENLYMYSSFENKLVEFSGIITSGDKYSISITCSEKIHLDSLVCFYRPDLPFSDTILRINEYTFTRLVETAKIEQNTYKMNIYFIHPNNRTDKDIQDLCDLLFRD